MTFFAQPLVSSQLGVAPGFSAEQTLLTVKLLRLNLIATLIFSISGLVMAGLQANQHFLLPALAPIFYDFRPDLLARSSWRPVSPTISAV